MHRTKTLLRWLTLWLMLSTVSAQPATAGADGAAVYKRKFLSFGTFVELMLSGVPQSTAERLFEEVENEFRYMQKVWWPWQNGALRRINTLLPSNEWFSVAPSVRPLLVRARQLALSSDHLFNPAIGKLVELWGFNKPGSRHGKIPDRDAIRRLVEQKPRMTDIEFRGIRMRGHNPSVLIDLGAVAKGYAIDRIINLLQHNGVHNAILNTGGDLKVIGTRGSRPWRIAIRHPDKRNRLIASFDARPGESVFTSGDYERYFIANGKRYHHILDPRTGFPAAGFRSVTVIHPDATLADAAATAIFVAGPAQWQRIARKMGIIQVLIVDAQGQLLISRTMHKRLRFAGPEPSRVSIITLGK